MRKLSSNMLLSAAGQSSQITRPSSSSRRATEQALGLGVEWVKRHSPVQAVEARRHRLQHAGDEGGPLALAGGVVGRAEQPDRRAAGSGRARGRGRGPSASRRPGRTTRYSESNSPQLSMHCCRLSVARARSSGCTRALNASMLSLEVSRVVAEHADQLLVPRQPAADEVPVERADAAGVDRQPPAHPVASRTGGPGRRARARSTAESASWRSVATSLSDQSRGAAPNTHSAPITRPLIAVSGMPRYAPTCPEVTGGRSRTRTSARASRDHERVGCRQRSPCRGNPPAGRSSRRSRAADRRPQRRPGRR